MFKKRKITESMAQFVAPGLLKIFLKIFLTLDNKYM